MKYAIERDDYELIRYLYDNDVPLRPKLFKKWTRSAYDPDAIKYFVDQGYKVKNDQLLNFKYYMR